MEIGIFDTTYTRPTLEQTLDAIVQSGIHAIQFHFKSVGLPELPERIDPVLQSEVRRQMQEHGITMSSVSGTFNMSHPDLAVRQDGIQRLHVLAATCEGLGTSVITLCTGTRNTASMWRPHPDNGTPEAWRDMLATMQEAVAIAEKYGVTLAFEPEVSNVVDSAQKARRLIDEMQSPNLKVVMDGANIYHKGELPRMREILTEAFDLLGPDIALTHAKDLDRDGEAGHLAAGQGLLDYDLYIRLLRQSNYRGPLVLHGLTESQVPGCVAFLKEKIGQN